jgi:chromosome partitioning protein
MITVVGNLKGGTGKSTVAFNLAIWLAKQGKKTALFDLDPQNTFKDVLDVRLEEGYEPILSSAGDLVALENLAKKPSAEVVIDVSIADKVAMLAAIKRADRVVIPCAPSQADIWSTQKFLSMIREEAGNKKVFAFINRADTHHMVVETKEAEDALDLLKGVTRLPIRLYQRTAYRRSFSEGLAVFELNAYDKAAQEVLTLAALLYPQYVKEN